jgi:hypothetical protein
VLDAKVSAGMSLVDRFKPRTVLAF